MKRASAMSSETFEGIEYSQNNIYDLDEESGVIMTKVENSENENCFMSLIYTIYFKYTDIKFYYECKNCQNISNDLNEIVKI